MRTLRERERKSKVAKKVNKKLGEILPTEELLVNESLLNSKTRLKVKLFIQILSITFNNNLPIFFQIPTCSL